MKKKIAKTIKSISDNGKIILSNVIGAFLIKGLALIVSLATMPAYIAYFNNDATLGIWFTLLSVIQWVINFDLGISNGLRNTLTEALTKRDYSEAKKLVSSAYLSITVVCLAIGVVIFGIAFFVDWNFIFNVETTLVSAEALRTSVIISFAGILLQMIIKIIQSVLYAIQKSAINNLLALCTSALTLLAVICLPSGDNDTNMLVMSVVHVLVATAPLLTASFIIYNGKTLKSIRPSFRCFTWKHSKSVISLGGMFFFVQVSYMLLLGTNEYFVTFFAQSDDVVDYKVYYQIFALGGTLFALALTPVWSVVTKAMAEQNFKWIKNLYNKLLLTLLAGGIIELAFIPILQFIINLWLGQEAIQVNLWYALVFAIFGTILMLNSIVSSIANGLGKLKTQAICFTIGFILKFATTGLFVSVFDSWIGVQVASVVSMLPFCIAQPIVLNKYLKSKIKGEK